MGLGQILSLVWVLLIGLASIVGIAVLIVSMRRTGDSKTEIVIPGDFAYEIIAESSEKEVVDVHCRVSGAHSRSELAAAVQPSGASDRVVFAVTDYTTGDDMSSRDAYRDGREAHVINMDLNPLFESSVLRSEEPILSLVIARLKQRDSIWVHSSNLDQAGVDAPLREPSTLRLFSTSDVAMDDWSRYLNNTNGLLEDFTTEQVGIAIADSGVRVNQRDISSKVLGLFFVGPHEDRSGEPTKVVAVVEAEINQPLAPLQEIPPGFKGYTQIVFNRACWFNAGKHPQPEESAAVDFLNRVHAVNDPS